MWPYWLLFLVPAFQSVSRLRQAIPELSSPKLTSSWQFMFIVLAVVIGMRHEVGGDWVNYIDNLDSVVGLSLYDVLSRPNGDPADGLVSWIAAQLGLGIYLVNIVYGMLFALGLSTFCHTQPRPWLALTVAVPYLITVVAMGYSRQGVAIGLVMMGLVALEKQSLIKFVLWVGFAALFHKSAIILVPLAILAGTRRRLFTLVWVCLLAVLLFGLLLQEHVDRLVAGYITDQYNSAGAGIRIAMNALPAALFLLFRKRFHLAPAQLSFWSWLSLSSIAFIGLLYVSPSSTAVDRVALYWIPLQLFVWSRVPDAMGRLGSSNAGWVFAVVAYSAMVHFVWLFFATHSVYWLPYQFYPWVWLWK
jgi:hypothetical protein